MKFDDAEVELFAELLLQILFTQGSNRASQLSNWFDKGDSIPGIII
jgi:hypothetical protein